MTLSVELKKKIVNFLISLPNINDSDTRQAFIHDATLDEQLQRQIKFSGSAGEFFNLLIPVLIQYGQLEDGRNAVEAVLETAKDYVGRDRRAYCDHLIQQLRPISMRMDSPLLTPTNLGIQLSFPGDPQDFNETKRQVLFDVIAGLLDIEKSSIQISYIMPDRSFKVGMKLPSDAALELAALFETKEKQAVQSLHQLSVKSVDVIEEWVLIHADHDDSVLTEAICSILKKLKVHYVLPLQSNRPSENREFFEDAALDCDAVIIVYGRVNVRWVVNQILNIRKIIARREQPLAVAILDGPPEQKPPLPFRFPWLHILQCRSYFDEEQVEDFIKSFTSMRNTAMNSSHA